MENENNFVEENKLFESLFFSHLTSPKDSRYRSSSIHSQLSAMDLGSGFDSATSSLDDAEDDVDQLFYFESDHIALRENADYKSLTRAVVQLEAQRIKAISDLDTLYTVQRQAIENPINFVDKLQKKDDLGIPSSITVAPLPHIPWEKYTATATDTFPTIQNSNFGVTTRRKFGQPDQNDSDSAAPVTSTADSNAGLVRGRVKDGNKPQNFNVLWTAEEQQRLEELLLEYPPEEVEARRWEKIAKALGNRTTLQVSSRVQKYFIKLAKAGLPIPGRLPNVAMYKCKDRKSHRHQRHNHFYFQPSTFLQAYEPPVYMNDDDNDASIVTTSAGYNYKPSEVPVGVKEESEPVLSDEDDIPLELRNTPEYRSILRLKKLKRTQQHVSAHVGFKCDICDMDPIKGTRWHCMECPTAISTDFCDKCMSVSYTSEFHDTHHQLKAIAPGDSKSTQKSAGKSDSLDTDYISGVSGQFSYLDPNYIPAT